MDWIKQNEIKSAIRFKNQRSRARNPNSWFGAAVMNCNIAQSLYRKYNSNHKRLSLSLSDSLSGVHKKKWRIDLLSLELHKYILMFFGLCVECNLKGLIVHCGEDPLEEENGKPVLKRSFAIHKLCKLYRRALGVEPSAPEKETLSRLTRAIESAKYPIESTVPDFEAYTAYLDNDVKITKKLLRRLERPPK